MIKRYDPEIERGWETCDDEARMVEIKGGHYLYAQDLHYELRQLLARHDQHTYGTLVSELEKLLEELK